MVLLLIPLALAICTYVHSWAEDKEYERWERERKHKKETSD